MKITPLAIKEKELNKDPKLNKLVVRFQSLINELNEKELPQEIVSKINNKVGEINNSSHVGKSLRALIRKSQTYILNLLQKDLKIVPQHHYRNLWLAMGMAMFGVPMGVTFGLLMDNLGLLGVGLPIGSTIGIAIGMQIDKKAKTEGRQLAVVLN